MTRPRWWEWLVLAGVIGIIYAILAPVFYSAKPRKRNCISNLKQQGTGLLMYIQDYDEKFPDNPRIWMDACYPYVKNWKVFHCYAVKEEDFGYAFYAPLSGKQQERLTNPRVVEMIFENMNRSKNALSSGEGFSTRHSGYGNVAFADGHVKALRREAFEALPSPIWQETKQASTKK